MKIEPQITPPATKSNPVPFYVLLGALAYAFIQTFTMLSPIILSFLIVMLISLALNPLIFRMRAMTGGRNLPTGLIVVIFLGVLALTGWAFMGSIRDSADKLSQRLPHYWERLQKPLIKMDQETIISEEKVQTQVASEIAQPSAPEDKVKPVPLPKAVEEAPPMSPEPGSLHASLAEMLQGVIGSFAAVAFNVAEILFVLVTVFFGVIFTLTNPRPILGTAFSLLPERHHNQTLIILQRIGKFVPGWAGATLLGMFTIALLVFLLMWPIFGFADAMVLAITAGLLEAIPFLGPILSSVPALLLAFGKGGMTPLWVLLAYMGVQSLENNVIMPLIMSRGLQLHPVAVIFSMLLCVTAFGVLGALVAAPLVAIVIILHDELYRKRFLPTVTDADLDRLARQALFEKKSVAD